MTKPTAKKTRKQPAPPPVPRHRFKKSEEFEDFADTIPTTIPENIPDRYQELEDLPEPLIEPVHR